MMDVDDDDEDGESKGIGLEDDGGDDGPSEDGLQSNMNIGGEDSQIDLDNLTES